MADPKTIADVLDKSIDKLSGGAAEVAKAVKQVAPHAWEVAVRQQVVEGWACLVPQALAALVLLVAYGLLLRHAGAWHASALAKGIRRFGKDVGDASDFWFPFVGLSVIAMMVLLLICGFGSRSVMQIANPEYYAAKAILEAVK